MGTIKLIRKWYNLFPVMILAIFLFSCSQDLSSSSKNQISEKSLISGGIVIHFEKPSSWSNAWIWYDKDSDNSWETTTLATSPGDMTEYRTVDSMVWYKKELESTSSVTFLFNQGDWGSKVTDNGSDFVTTADIWVRADGSYSYTDPHGEVTSFNVYFKKPSGWGTPYFYGWVDSSTAIAGSWPGTTMTEATEEGDDWYKYTISGQSSCNLIFNDNSNQTIDLSRDSDGWFVITGTSDGKYIGTWTDSNPEGDTPPVITISPEGQDFTESPFNVNVTITSSNTITDRIATLTVNGGVPSVVNLPDNDEDIDLSAYCSVGDSIILQVYAKDDEDLETTSSVESYNYQEQAGFNVYFKLPSGWGAPYFYGWVDTSTVLAGAWPGTAMDLATDQGDDWYKYTVVDQTSCSIVFNDNSSQTVDLSREGTGWFVVTGTSSGKYTGTWYDANPDDSVAPTISITSPESGTTVSGTVNATVTAEDNIGVSKVEYYFDGTLLGESTTSPFTYSWVTTSGVSDTALLKAIAYDAAGNSGESEVTITVDNPNQSPVANAGSDITVTMGSTCAFDGTASYDPDGSIVSYSWTDGESGTMTGDSPDHIYDTVGTYTVVLTVTDDEGATGTDEVVVTVTEAPTTAAFSWDNATVYFVMTDRFLNGDTTNDNSYGRKKDYTQYNDTVVGTFQGGDIAGLTSKLDYLDELGVNVIWMSGPFEQAHGWVGGADDGNFPHYGYHGYYTLDHTMIDKNMGTVEEMRTFVTEAHNRGIRVILDIVLNHPGYASLLDMYDYGFGGVSVSSRSELEQLEYSDGNWHNYHDDYIDYNNSSSWTGFWGTDWVRAGLPGYDFITTDADADSLRCNLDSLPDFKSESYSTVAMSPLLQTKWASESSGYDNWQIPAALTKRTGGTNNPTGYVISWLAAWVEEFGIDGFRCDTVKHVEEARWSELKSACQTALTTWRNSSNSDNDPAKEWTDSFWMTGEYWGYGRDTSGGSGGYYDCGFDNMIDFSYSVPDSSGLESQFNNYITSASLPYISSHDTGSVYYNGDSSRQIWAGTALLLNTSPVQIFYGDEIGRENGPCEGDENQGSRSAFEWDKVDNAINLHWKKIGKFRQQHVAIGAGTHSKISDSPYTFSRVKDDDKVVVCLNASGTVSIDVSSIFSNGTEVKDAYSGSTATVANGAVSFSGDVILIEEVE